MSKTILKLGPAYKDERGMIQMVLEDEAISSVSIISSKAGSTRASHWHKKDSHYCWVQSGKIEYFERPVGSNSTPKFTLIQEGELFYTPPLAEHEMYFPEDTVFHCYSTLSRKNKNYENDTTRLGFSLKDVVDNRPF
jgi:dTDP-4-dehydrorhamnose 3,5-epimerase-like enzyme